MTDLHLAVETPAVKVDLRHPSLYLNRELSWLEFNRRVLHEALDPARRCSSGSSSSAIFSSNLDEFFQVRVAGLKQQVAAGISRAHRRRNDAGGAARAISATRARTW